MKRGELWTARGASYISKPRPVLIVQSNAVDVFDSTILCLITSHESDELPARIKIEPTRQNGLREISWVMVDKLYSARKDDLGQRIGTLSVEDMSKVSESLAHILGLDNEQHAV